MIFFIFDFLSSLFIASAKGDFEIQGPISPLFYGDGIHLSLFQLVHKSYSLPKKGLYGQTFVTLLSGKATPPMVPVSFSV